MHDIGFDRLTLQHCGLAVVVGLVLLALIMFWSWGCDIHLIDSRATAYAMPRCDETAIANNKTLKLRAMYVYSDSCTCSYNNDGKWTAGDDELQMACPR